VREMWGRLFVAALAIECKQRYGKAWNFMRTLSKHPNSAMFPDFHVIRIYARMITRWKVVTRTE
jgi:hypothetical protein